MAETEYDTNSPKIEDVTSSLTLSHGHILEEKIQIDLEQVWHNPS